MKLVAGSYERFLWGYDVKPKKQELQWKFAYPAHNGPIKCIATSGAVVATGGVDDTIRVFDLNAQKDMGSLIMHDGAVTCLDFHNSHPGVNHPTHLLSGSEDGSICIWDTDAWIHLLTMKAKKGPKAPVQDLSIHTSGGAVTCSDYHNSHPGVNHPMHLMSGSEDGSICIWDTDAWIHLLTMKAKKGPKAHLQDLSIHTSGLLALSIERNNSMKMWNLTKGRCSFTTKLPQQAEIVNFFPQAGESYALALGNIMEIRNAETGSTIHRLEHDKRIYCMAQRQDNMLVTGGEDCIVRAWDTRSGKQAWWMENAHTNRIKGVAILGSKSDAGDESGELPHLVASASSDGLLKVWDTRMVSSEDGVAPVPLMQAETKARLTCLVSSSGVKKTPASESIPEGDVVGKQHSSAGEPGAELEGTGQVSKKKKRKTGADGNDAGEEKSLSGKKRHKKQAVKENAKKSPANTPLPSTTAPITNTPGSKSLSHRKRANRDSKSQEGDIGTPHDHSQHKKPKLSSKKLSYGPGKSPKSGKSSKSLGSGKPGKKGDKRR